MRSCEYTYILSNPDCSTHNSDDMKNDEFGLGFLYFLIPTHKIPMLLLFESTVGIRKPDMSGFQMVEKRSGARWSRFRTPFQTESFCSDFDCHPKSKPFDVRTLFNHYNTGLVRYIWDLKYRLVWISNGQKKFKLDLKSGHPNIWNPDKRVPFCQKP